MKLEVNPARPPVGAICSCGKPAKYIVRGNDTGDMVMCERHATDAVIVKAGESFRLRNAQGPDEQLPVEFETPTASDTQLKQVSELAEQQRRLIHEIEVLQDQLDRKNQALKINQEVDLPAAMAAANLESFTDNKGAKIEIKDIVAASIPKTETPQALAWLRKHKHGNLIKQKIVIEFGKNEESWARKFIRDMALRKKPLKATISETVHPQTLAAFVREMDREQESLPEKLLGVFRVRKAIISLPEIRT